MILGIGRPSQSRNSSIAKMWTLSPNALPVRDLDHPPVLRHGSDRQIRRGLSDRRTSARIESAKSSSNAAMSGNSRKRVRARRRSSSTGISVSGRLSIPEIAIRYHALSPDAHVGGIRDLRRFQRHFGPDRRRRAFAHVAEELAVHGGFGWSGPLASTGNGSARRPASCTMIFPCDRVSTPLSPSTVSELLLPGAKQENEYSNRTPFPKSARNDVMSRVSRPS